jgi:hypothetical protein
MQRRQRWAVREIQKSGWKVPNQGNWFFKAQNTWL